MTYIRWAYPVALIMLLTGFTWALGTWAGWW